MRKVILFFAAISLSSVGWSQTLNIHYKNGQTVQYNMQNIESLEFTEESPNSAQVTSGDAVDLGLSVKWASCNVGATSPEEYGDKFAWGEVNPKSKYNKSNYAYFDSNTESYIDIGMDIKGTDYDVAHVKWGGDWRMPTYAELMDLVEKCNWEWGQFKGVNGYIVTGPNGNSIFFPTGVNTIKLWTSEIASDTHFNNLGGKYHYAYSRGFDSGDKRLSGGWATSRYYGNYVRPVTPK